MRHNIILEEAFVFEAFVSEASNNRPRRHRLNHQDSDELILELVAKLKGTLRFLQAEMYKLILLNSSLQE